VRNNVTDCALGGLLSILKPYHPNLPLDPRTLKKTPQTYVIKEISGSDGRVGQYHYFGIGCGLLDLLQQHQQFDGTSLVLQFNFDGLPLFKSSNMELWPILCLARPVSCKPFVVGLYCGAKKPASLSDYLQEFVEELRNLLVEGIICNDIHYAVEVGCFVCDAPARSFVKNVKSHTGYSGCDKCKQEGVYMNNRMTFPEINAALRTDEEFQMMADEEHHHGPTPLSVIPIGLVSSFGFDYMHLVCLGVVRKLLKFWLCGPVHRDVQLASRLCAGSVKLLSDKLIKLHNSIPVEFARKPRSVSEVDRWKATEFRQFLLYTGPIVLPGVLSDAVYNHFLLLCVGITLLISPKLCVNYADYAHTLLCLFVEQASHLYGEDFIVYNVHGLTHLAADVKNHGSLDLFSAFPFENKMKALKSLVRKPNYPIAQLVRRLTEERTAFSEGRNIYADNMLCKLEHTDGPVPGGYEGAVQFAKLNNNAYCLNTKRYADCCMLLKNTGPVLAVNVLSWYGVIYVVYKRFNKTMDLFTYPLPSSSLGIYKVSESSNTLFVCTIDEIVAKCLLLPLSSVTDFSKGQPVYAAIPIVHTVLDECS
jgi:hypothetical protein